MVIRSQNKKCLISPNDMFISQDYRCDQSIGEFGIYRIIKGEYVLIGKYESKSRCRLILNDIFKNIKLNTKSYNMPEK